jgi:S-adenosylmethionine decarboxylase
LNLDLARPQPGREIRHNFTAPPLSMRLYVMDAWVRDAAVLVDADGISATLRAAAEAGGVTVLGETFHVFPNGAVTGILLLAQSHLSIHTWPELLVANIDLLTYGDVDGERVMRIVRYGLQAHSAEVTCMERASR